MIAPAIIIIVVILLFFIFVIVAAVFRKEKSKKKPTPQAVRDQRYQSISMPPILGSPSPRPSQAALDAFAGHRHPSWAIAAYDSPRCPPPSAPRRAHRPPSQAPVRPSRQISRPPQRPSSSPVHPPRHPTWAAAAQRAEEEEAARQGRPPPFKPLDLSIPPPTYHQHVDDARVTPVL